MKMFFFKIYFSVIIVATTFTACTEFVSDNNVTGETIGLPGNVNVMNENLANVKSRTGSDLLAPAIHTAIFQGSDKPLYLRYTTTPGILPLHDSFVKTRGTLITTDKFYNSYCLYTYLYQGVSPWAASAASISATYSDEEVFKGRNWSTSEFWPGNGIKCAFFAYAPYHAAGLSAFTTTGWPSFHYTVPTIAAEQNDLLVTRNDSSVGLGDYGNIDVLGNFNAKDYITFDHACTAIRFAIGKQMAPCTIKKIEIQNVYGEGDYQYQTEAWSNVSTLSTFSLTQDFVVKGTDKNVILNNDDNVFMMIPQQLPEGAMLAITINDGVEHVLKTRIDDDAWLKGYTVTYYLSTSETSSDYVLSVSPASKFISGSGGTDAITIKSYKQTYYGSQVAVPWAASYTYDENGTTGTVIYNSTNSVVTAFTPSGNGSITGENVNLSVAAGSTSSSSDVFKSHSEYNVHTKTLREAIDGSCDLAKDKQTANCYVIHAPGHYSLPLVYGNALNADKTPNTDSYNSSTFVDHQGKQITSPYIYETNGGVNVPYDACVVWQDAPQLVTPSSVKLSSGNHCIEFDIDRDNICQGNSVIAVRDKDGNIMWSWHIWVTDYALIKTYKVYNADNVISNFMEVPLGYCDADVRGGNELRKFHLTIKQTEDISETGIVNLQQISGQYSYGTNAPFYQWGRKDPILPSNGVNGNKPYYDTQYNPNNNIYSNNLKDMILYPYEFNTSSGYGNNELWSKGNTGNAFNDNTIHKTIYDPSPNGFKLPQANVYTGLSVNGNWNNGQDYYCNSSKTGETIFFPGFGWRNYDSNLLCNINSNGHYWTAIPCYALDIYSGNYKNPQWNGQRSYGFTSYPVLE